MRRSVVIGFLGTTLDVGKAERRWKRWRPTVSLATLKQPRVDRLELFFEEAHRGLAETVMGDVRALAPQLETRPQPVQIADPWDFEEVYATLYDFAKSYPFQPEDEDYYIHITTGTHVIQICLFLLCETRVIPARLLQTWAVDNRHHEAASQVIDLELSRYDAIAARFKKSAVEASTLLKHGIQTRNRAFNALISEIELVASSTRDPILLTGATGTGKTSLAKRIFALKEARGLVKPGAPLIEVNCATIQGALAMSTLFGHVKGSFTGALKEGVGLLELAHGGVLFLDEVGELGLDEQAMLLKAIEEKTFRPVGAQTEKRSDFQLICGTNRDLNHAVEQAQFREDLLARINLWEFQLPTLRERLEDVEPNLEFELDQFEQRTGQRVRFSRESKERFLHFAFSDQASWKGNFRDLSSAVTRMATLSKGTGRITLDLVEREILKQTRRPTNSRIVKSEKLEALLGSDRAASLCLFDRLQLEAVLQVCVESRSLAAAGRRLFGEEVASNATDRIRKFLLRYSIDPRRVLAPR